MRGLLLGIIFIGCSMTGVWIDEDQRKRIKELERFIYLFELLKGEIDYQLTPLKEGCFQVGQRDKEEIGKIFCSFAKALETKESADINKMWQQALAKYKNSLHLRESDYEILETFSGACGYLDKKMQTRNLERVNSQLEHERKRAEEQYERCSKLNKSLGVLIGAALVIFLI